jgi:hypothetical protein
MRLKKHQREQLISWIAEGMQTDEINARAEKFKPPFKVSTALVAHYRKTRGIQLGELKESGENDALTTGLAVKANRVENLQALADKLYDDLMNGDKLWLLQVKGIGSKEDFERITYYEFNSAEVAQYRGLVDDISAEVGERVRKTDLTSNGKPIGQNREFLKGSVSDEQLEVLEEAARIVASKRDPQPAQPG